ncbi:MAG: hypothetical protein V4676_06295 [Bacteroidota bacterium]
MLTSEEEKFLNYWSQQRLHKKKFLRRFTIGLPLASLLAVGVLINFLSGWYKRADADLRSNSSVIIVVMVALVGIVVFITIFSAHHRWDRNEAFYQELINRSSADKNSMQQV